MDYFSTLVIPEYMSIGVTIGGRHVTSTLITGAPWRRRKMKRIELRSPSCPTTHYNTLQHTATHCNPTVRHCNRGGVHHDLISDRDWYRPGLRLGIVLLGQPSIFREITHMTNTRRRRVAALCNTLSELRNTFCRKRKRNSGGI